MSQNWGSGGGGGNWGGSGGYGPPPGGPYGPGQTQPGPGGYPPPGGGGGFAPPPPGYPPGYTPMASGGVVAWEDASLGLFGRWWGTFKEVCFNPKGFHQAASRSEDPWPAVTFAVTNGAIVGVILGIFVALLYLAIGGIGAVAASSAKSGAGPAAGVFGVLAAIGIGVAIGLPILYIIMGFIVPWVSGGLHHLGLLVVGGANRPYSSTVRVVGYSSAAQIFSFLPGFGGLISIGLMIVSMVIGFDETHKCGTGKAIFAAIWPFLLVCLCYCGCYLFVGIMTTAAGHR